MRSREVNRTFDKKKSRKKAKSEVETENEREKNEGLKECIGRRFRSLPVCARDIKINFRYTIKIDGEGECGAMRNEANERGERINEKQIDKTERASSRNGIELADIGAICSAVTARTFIVAKEFHLNWKLAMFFIPCSRRSRLRYHALSGSNSLIDSQVARKLTFHFVSLYMCTHGA